MRRLYTSRGLLLGGVLAALAIGLVGASARADDEKPDPRPDAMKEALRQLERFRERFERDGGFRLDVPGFPGEFGRLPGVAGKGRLGAVVRVPDETLSHQLDLPRDQGLVLDDVRPDSAAAKAGLAKHDVLLELDGKPVPSDVAEFVKQLADVKADAAVEAVVLRKGKKETVKGLKLPAKDAVASDLPGFGRLGRLLPAGGGTTVVSRTDDRFTATQKDGKVAVTVKGKVDGGKAKLESVTVEDGSEKKTYEALDEVPADHKKRVEGLLRLAGGGGAKADDY